MAKIFTNNNKLMTIGNSFLCKYEDPYNPLELPPLTIRIKVSSGTPSISNAIVTPVAGQERVFDVCTNGTSRGTNWYGLLSNVYSTLYEILGANSTGVTYMSSMCYNCSNLRYIALFDTSSVITFEEMFESCGNLKNIPLFNTSSATNMSSMFKLCYSVESGALALYQQASTQANPPSSHQSTFTACGQNTTSGLAELNQIPKSWGGRA